MTKKKYSNGYLVFILLPIYNEDIGIKILIKKLIKHLDQIKLNYKIICVNDGSTDNTLGILNSLKFKKIKIINHEINLGLGSAVMTGIKYVVGYKSKYEKILVRLDADNSHDPKYIKHMLNEIIYNNYDIIIASRFVKGGEQMGVPTYRNFISNLANFLIGKLLGMPNIKETTCGYRAYKISFVKRAINFWDGSFFQLVNFGFSSTVEKLTKFSLCKAKIKEIPFKLRYDKKKSESKMVFSITTIGYIIMFILYHWPLGGWKYQKLKK